ncbi:TIR domain-containing protein [Saccharopolyspora erythraea NRRL 2338]|uniref:Uncharacterized protein n=2 Tax=Saccharopolyspora erythraea TaxID=1836 RepID=A4FF24_SACEN|nr:toll/interleukin-1 receptor domain-containing protein [Saccharopolyspora erythraea]PFG96374.1 TIR domain-containing protein [Saccharopolyspora erythraea NRRL 2338]QRK92880.1 toll/interleukin-1 receptor domain-containing protein [Saccharopolyspora erythraea]CAM02649.1 hypothetical protein SACE_3374 [Saccharopolyspora erythraea NRRL 2338]
MHDVFINYRTGDDESAAALIDQDLSLRFGSERIFRASKSIEPGEDFTERLVAAVRQCRVLLVVIGPRWLTARGADGRNALDDESDWTRREILEAFDRGIRVVPVLVGRTTERLARADLPPALAELADCQYRRLDLRNSEADLAQIAAKLSELVPGLVDRSGKEAPKPAAAGNTYNSVGNVTGWVVQADVYHNNQSGGIGNVAGNIGTYIDRADGPLHTGSGNQYNNSTHSSGDGVNHVANNKGRIRQRFGDGGEDRR